MSSALETQVFGPYRVLTGPDGQPALLGRGAFGTVFHAQHGLTSQEVALKVIHDHLAANEQVRRRFRDEAREHKRLKHEGVVQILDSGETEISLYLAMEFCAGRDLQSWSSSRGPAAPLEVLTLMRPIADALVYAAGHGLIHRDIKPSNILLVAPPVPGILPTVKLADFGLAKKVWEETGANGGVTLSASHSGGIKGTLQYASPEQVREEKIDSRSDMFSLGLTMWHLLAGRYPFADQTTLQFIKERAEVDSYQDRFPAGWPACLKELMGKLIAGKADDRYSAFGRVVGAIDYCLEELVEKVKPPPLPANRPPALLPVREFYSLNWLEETPVGTLFDASPVAGSSVDGSLLKHQHLTLLRRDLAPSLREEIRQSVTRLTANPHPALAAVEWRETRDGATVIIDLPPGTPILLDVLRLEGPRRFIDSLPWLEQLAGALDHAARLGLPGVETAPAAISVVSGGTADSRRLLLTAKLYRTNHESQTTSSLTMVSLRPGEGDGGSQVPAAAFAFLAYRLLSSRDPKQAALSTPTAYVAIDALSETGNRYLREALCGNATPACLDLLSLLCQAEAVPFHRPAPSSLTSPPLPSPFGATPAPGSSTFAPAPLFPPVPSSAAAPSTPLSGSSLHSHSGAGLSMLKTVLDAAELEKNAALERARQERESALALERQKAEQALAMERQRAEAERRELAQRADLERSRIIEEAKKQAEAERLQVLEERRQAGEERARAETARQEVEARMEEERRQLAAQTRLLEEKLARHGEELAAEREKNTILEEKNHLLTKEKNLLQEAQQQLLEAKEKIEGELGGLRDRELNLSNQVDRLRLHEHSLLSQVESLNAAERKAAHDAEEHAHRAAEAAEAAQAAAASGTIDAEAAQAAAAQAQRDREQSLKEVERLQTEREQAESLRQEITRQAEAQQSLLAQTTTELRGKDEELQAKNSELQLKAAEVEEKISQIALLSASKQEAEARATLQEAARTVAEAERQAALEFAQKAEAERIAAETKLRELTAAREKAEAERREVEERAAKQRAEDERRAREKEAELRAKAEAERAAVEKKLHQEIQQQAKAREKAEQERQLAEKRAKEAVAGGSPGRRRLAWAAVGLALATAGGTAAYYATRPEKVTEKVKIVVHNAQDKETRTFFIKGSAGIPQLDDTSAQHFTILKAIPQGDRCEIGVQSISEKIFPADVEIAFTDQAGSFRIKPGPEKNEVPAPANAVITIHRADSTWGAAGTPVKLLLKTDRGRSEEYTVPAGDATSPWTLRLPEGAYEFAWQGPIPSGQSIIDIPVLDAPLKTKKLAAGEAPSAVTLTLPQLPLTTLQISGRNEFQYLDKDKQQNYLATAPTVFFGAFDYPETSSTGAKARARLRLATLNPNGLFALPAAAFFHQWATSDPAGINATERSVVRTIAQQLDNIFRGYEAQALANPPQATLELIDACYKFWSDWEGNEKARSLFDKTSLQNDPRFYVAWSMNWMLTAGPLRQELSGHYRTQRLATKLDATGALDQSFVENLLADLVKSPHDFWALLGQEDGWLRGTRLNGELDFNLNPSELNFTVTVAPGPSTNGSPSWKNWGARLQAPQLASKPIQIIPNIHLRLEADSLHLSHP